MDQLLDITAMLASDAIPTGRGVGIFTASGGAGAWLIDALHIKGLAVPELPAADRAKVAELLPYYANSRNPVDYTAGAQDQAKVSRALEILAGAEDIDVLVVVLSLVNTESVANRLPGLLRTVEATGKPMIVYTYTDPAPDAIALLAEAGVPWFRSQTGLADAIARSGVQAATTAARATEDPPKPAFPMASAWSTLTEHQVKTWLRREGFPVPDGALVQSADEAVAAAERIGFPVALKLQSAAASHKTDLGAIAVGLASGTEVEAAWATVTRAIGREVPADQVDGVLVEAMAAPGVEMMVGLVTEPGLGPFVVVGSGGVAAEAFHDVAILPAPIAPPDAEAAIGRLRLAPLLLGWRGAPPCDVGALAEAVSRISQLAVGERAIRELDLNPVVVHRQGEGVVVLDGLAVVDAASGAG
jgi:acyl-CoA synthetase (NDP forming)